MALDLDQILDLFYPEEENRRLLNFNFILKFI